MKLTLSQQAAVEVFGQALRTCNTAAVGEPDSEFLFNIKEDGSVTVTSLDDYSEQELPVPVQGVELDEPGLSESFSVSGQRLVGLVKEFPANELTCSFDGSVFVIEGGGTSATLPTGSPDEFAPFNFEATGVRAPVSGTSLAALLSDTAFSASRDYVLAPMTAVQLVVGGGKLIARSTDNSRCTVSEVEAAEAVCEPVALLVPKSAATTLAALALGRNAVTLEVGQRHLQASWSAEGGGECVFTCRLEFDGHRPFPEVDPEQFGKNIAQVVVSRARLTQSLKLAALLAGDTFLRIGIVEGGLGIMAFENTKGASRDLVPAHGEVSGGGETFVPCRLFQEAALKVNAEILTLSLLEEEGYSTLGIVARDGAFQHYIFPTEPNQALLEGAAVDEESGETGVDPAAAFGALEDDGDYE